jgi:hypothetical protein
VNFDLSKEYDSTTDSDLEVTAETSTHNKPIINYRWES